MQRSTIYAICVDVLMILMWSFFIVTAQVPEYQSRPAEIILHLIDEFMTALLLLVAGISAIGRKNRGNMLLLPAIGMLLYPMIVSPGYYIQKGNVLLVNIFTALLLMAIVEVILQLRRLIRAIK